VLAFLGGQHVRTTLTVSLVFSLGIALAACVRKTQLGDAVLIEPTPSIWGTTVPILELPRFPVDERATHHFEVRGAQNIFPQTLVLIDTQERAPGWHNRADSAPWSNLVIHFSATALDGSVLADTTLDFQQMDTSAYWVDRESTYALQWRSASTIPESYDVEVTVIGPANRHTAAFVRWP